MATIKQVETMTYNAMKKGFAALEQKLTKGTITPSDIVLMQNYKWWMNIVEGMRNMSDSGEESGPEPTPGTIQDLMNQWKQGQSPPEEA